LDTKQQRGKTRGPQHGTLSHVPRLISTILQTFICPESVEQKAIPWDEMGFNDSAENPIVGWWDGDHMVNDSYNML
jgi:hypothetical protein